MANSADSNKWGINFGVLFGDRKPKEPTPEEVELRRVCREEAEKVKLYRAERTARPAHEAISEELVKAGLPANAKDVVGRLCSYWCSTNHDDFPYVSQIIGARVNNYHKLELTLASGPRMPSGTMILLFDNGTLICSNFQNANWLLYSEFPSVSVSITKFQLL